MLIYSNSDEKKASENTLSWDGYTSLIHQKNYHNNLLLILVVTMLLAFSVYGLYILLPTNRVSVYSMQINHNDHGNFLIIEKSNIPADQLDLDQYTSNNNIKEN